MKKFISHLWYSGGVFAFNTTTGSVTPTKEISQDKTGFGSIWKQNGKYFAFYQDDDSLLLQYKSTKWRITPEYKVSLHAYLFFRNFKIKHKNKVVYSLWYKPKNLFLPMLDPTYDALDAEFDDFFLYVKNTWKYWGNRPYSEFKNEFKDRFSL